MSAAAAAAIRELPSFDAGREAERQDVMNYIRERAATAVRIGDKGHRLTEAEAKRLERWLRALADDIGAELHVDGED